MVQHNKSRLTPATVATLLPALLLLLCNIFVFGTFAVYAGSPKEFEVGYLEMLAYQKWWLLALMVLLLLPALAHKRNFKRRYVVLIFVLGVLTWVQANFLLWDYGVFDGRDTAWSRFDVYGWLDIILWLGCTAAAIRFTNRIYPLVKVLSWILIAGQAVLMAGQAPDTAGFLKKNYTYSNSLPAPFLELSRKRNVIHFILDSFQTDIFLQLLDEGDAYRDFSGFTVFRDNAAAAPTTSLAVPAMFLGRVYDGSEPPSRYYKEALTEGFQDTLYDEGYIVNLIPQLSMRLSKYSNYYEIPSDYRGTVRDLKRLNTARLDDVALFRNAPHFLRKKIYGGGDWLLSRLFRGRAKVRSFREKAFLEDYLKGVRVATAKPVYNFIHLNPPHPPYVTKADGTYAGHILPNTRDNYLNEARPVFALIRRYIARLKSLGVYDDAMIVLQGDHGSQIDPVIDGQEVKPCLTRLPALLAIKPPGARGPLKISTAPTSVLDIAPTILKLVDKNQRSAFDLKPDSQRTRPYIYMNAKKEVTTLSSYEVDGSVYDPQSCRKVKQVAVSRHKSVYEYGSELRFGMAGNADAFMGVGWGSCAAEYCWSDGRVATLVLPVESTDSALDMDVRLMSFVSESKVPQQRIRLSVNGEPVTEWVSHKKSLQAFSVRIPARLVTGDELRIAFGLPDAVVPKSLGLGGDERRLGVALVSLRLSAVDGDAKDGSRDGGT